jgi:hypothetical protein
MKLIISVLFLLASYIIQAQKPIAYFKFDNSAKDYSGNGNNGILHGSVEPTMDRFGNHCGAYLFDGVTGYIEVPSSPTLEKPANQFTITVWCRLNSKRTNYWLTVACKGATNHESIDNPQYRFQLQQDLLHGMPKCNMNPSNGFSTISLNTPFTACDNQYTSHPLQPFEWCFYALVFGGNKVMVYMNDQIIFEGTYSLPLQKNNAPLFIGLDEPGTTEYFDGAMDDLYLFDEALDVNAIRKIYNEKRPVKWDKEELIISTLSDKTVALTAGKTALPVIFDPPKVSNNGCGQVNITQILGDPSGTPLSAGKHLITYRIRSTSGYEAHSSFYITIRNNPDPATPATHATGSTTPVIPSLTSQTPSLPASLPPVKDTALIYIPKDLTLRETIEKETVEVRNTHLKLVMYDNAQYDGDTVSIFLNNQPVISRQEVQLKGTTFYVDIDSTTDNILLVYAENLGSISPNTAVVVLHDGDIQHKLFLSSSLKQNISIRIRKKKK